jgi:predicted ATP-grasp superfamily ATP-dependent carboligase
MDYIAPDILAGELTPVMVGLSTDTVELARKMHEKYGVISHVFCDKVPLLLRLSLFMKFHVVQHTKDEHLMVQALTDFADPIRNADLILYLLPCSEEYVSMIWESRETLESRYVIAELDEIDRLLEEKEKKEERI